jgi:hypothetical protein
MLARILIKQSHAIPSSRKDIVYMVKDVTFHTKPLNLPLTTPKIIFCKNFTLSHHKMKLFNMEYYLLREMIN